MKTTLGQMTLENFGPFKEASLDFSSPGLHIIRGENRDTTGAGSNGSGKSLLLEGMYWVLYGLLITGDSKAGVIRSGSKKAIGTLVFENDEGIFIVERSRSASSGTLSIKTMHGEDEQDLSGQTVKDTQAVVEKLLGIDALTFRNTVFFGQGDSSRFADPGVGDAERKALLKRILGMQIVDDALAATKETIAGLNTEVGSLNTKLSRYEGQLEAKLQELARCDERVSEHAGVFAAKKKELAKLKKAKPVSSSGRDVASLRKNAATIEKSIAEVQETIDIVEGERDEASSIEASYFSKVRQVQSEITGIAGQIALFDAGACPTCKTPIGEGTIAETIQELRDLLDYKKKTKRKMEKAKEKAHKEVSAAEDKLRTLRSGRGEMTSNLALLQTDIASLESEVEGNKRLAQAKKEDLQSSAEFGKRLVTERHRLKAVCDGIEEDLAGLTELISAKQKEAEHLRFWVAGFGPQGVANYVIDSILPLITKNTNEYLSTLSDGDITATFDTQTTLKGGGVRDKFSVELNIEGAGDVRASGGQSRKVQIAASLALADLLRAYHNSPIDMLVLDEVLDGNGMDSVSQARVVDMLMGMAGRVQSIWVVSHSAAVENVFESVHLVRKKGGVATVTSPKRPVRRSA